MITIENYEEYFLLYIDNELPAAERAAVEKFVADNPRLQVALLQCRVRPDEDEVFPDKEALLREDLLSYIDGELDAPRRKAVEEFVGRYPSKAVELQQLSMTVSHPDLTVCFPGKESLYRTERRRRLLPMPWMQAGIAAAVLGFVALLLFPSRHPDIPAVVKAPATVVKTPATVVKAPATVQKNAPRAVTPVTPAPLYSAGSDD
jgi:hypothetical protein